MKLEESASKTVLKYSGFSLELFPAWIYPELVEGMYLFLRVPRQKKDVASIRANNYVVK